MIGLSNTFINCFGTSCPVLVPVPAAVIKAMFIIILFFLINYTMRTYCTKLAVLPSVIFNKASGFNSICNPTFPPET